MFEKKNYLDRYVVFKKITLQQKKSCTKYDCAFFF